MEEEKTIYPASENIDQGVVSFLRDAPPADYSIKIDSFSKLVNLKIDKYESATFNASGFSWRLILYPNGNVKRGCKGHISLYLAIDSTQLDFGEAYATYKMFVYDHHKDKYLTIQDGSAQRYHRAKKESGFDRLISLDTFNAATNGYLVDDSCIFGVEVSAVKYTGNGYTGNGETLELNIENHKEVTFNWKISEFSKMRKRLPNGHKLMSDKFTAGKYKWCVWLYPNGDSGNKDRLSLYLACVEGPLTGKKVLAEFSLEIQNQNGKTQQQARTCHWFSTTKSNVENVSWGWAGFMLLSDLEKESSGYKQKDTILVQAKVNIKTEVTNFS